MIVGGGKVFACGRMGPLAALDAANGEILWKYHHPSVESRAAPTYADGRLFVMRIQGGLKESPYVRGWFGGRGSAGVWCHDAETGKPLWHVPMDFAYHFNPDALAVHDGLVFACRHVAKGQFEAVALDAATGKEVWTAPIDGFAPEKANGPRRFSGVMSDGLWCVSLNSVLDRAGQTDAPGATLAFEAKTGRLVWRNDEVFISVRTRIAARKGVLMVFNTTSGAHALDTKTGEQLWHRPSTGKFYQHALTDLYLESQGEQGAFKEHQCSYQIFINGLWYSHAINSSNFQQAKRFHESGKPEIVWKQSFISNACPSPSPAYDLLYYSPNGEGVVYCFASSAAKEAAGAATSRKETADGLPNDLRLGR
jgi:outer membrane protein assembly factor BamB